MAFPALDGATQFKVMPPPLFRLIAVNDVGRPGTVVATSGPASAESTDSDTEFRALILYLYLTPERRPVKTNGARFDTV